MKRFLGTVLVGICLLGIPSALAVQGGRSMVIITAAWKAKPGREAELARHLKTMVANVKKHEPNCLLYTLHQGLEDKTRYYFYEQYTDMQAVEFHKTTPHFHALIANTEALIAEPVNVGLYEAVE
ncbi:MAG: antibiotic biosynthesis monooxygenase [Deltaproteobacteria bacterium]|nr:antibiotic biosynthesis monooxygenase [Deltaproteobacteria bacterium]